MSDKRTRGHPPVPRDQARRVRMALLVTPGDAKKINKARGSVPLSEWLRDTVLKALAN